jgi:hypothetical protein
MYTQYIHHGKEVWVREDLKGTNRDVCMCYDCTKFKLINQDGESSCPIAKRVFDNCVELSVVTPVYECPAFEEGERYKFTTQPGQ